MIVSRVEKTNEHDGNQIILVKGSAIEITTEISNVIKEVLKRGLPEEVLLTSIIEAFEDYKK